MQYNIPYFKYNFDFKQVDENLYRYFKANSIDKILTDHEDFRKKKIAEFKEENKREYRIYLISLFTFLISCFITFGSIFEALTVNDSIAGFFGLMILFSFFGLFYCYSFSLSWGEMRRTLKKRKKVLKKAHKYAQKTSSFSEFIDKIKV